MRRRRSLRVWLILLLCVVTAGYFGTRLLVARAYPLEYRVHLFRYAEANDLDPWLVAAVIRAESRFRHDAVSRQGARGLMQIMPETGEWIAEQLKLPYAPELLFDPEYNIRLGCWYLANLEDEFRGSTVLALAAYNGGRSNVNRWLQEDRWTGEQHTLEQIPFPETRLYVAKVLRDVERYRRIYAAD